jgi:hypothetical protein
MNLQHDKSHVFDMKVKNSTLDSILRKIGQSYSGTLYRGVGPKSSKYYNLDKPTLLLDHYSSWTPDKKIAEEFGQDGILLTLKLSGSTLKVLNYYQFIVNYMKHIKQIDPRGYSFINGDQTIEGALEEKEVILPIGIELVLKNYSNNIYNYELK